MTWKHTFKHIDASDSLKEYAEYAFEKVGRHLLKDSQWQVFYSKGKHADCCIEVTVQNGTGHFKATAHATDFYESVDEVAEKLGKQFQKKREKLKGHKSYGLSKEAQLEHLNEMLEHDHSPYHNRKQPA